MPTDESWQGAPCGPSELRAAACLLAAWMGMGAQPAAFQLAFAVAVAAWIAVWSLLVLTAGLCAHFAALAATGAWSAIAARRRLRRTKER